ncbi:hypothetical protein BCV69DRAFT_277643 [Microstroma glucosiphilum]|uniref:Uncharacterized protein n=1 Tax=Pseudomicrostroma glucosiphilum TaxID=1684307 RepID=A0A316U6E8_9BASI|nr:hypothetical protein BCV69DRAFT_277643 [Pseudomicrostroma glucosiphilum]PWN20404.1 hypothetical protein BCV69DRAFT_277643 [Pseudomicrostroma glucosiphilum]
MAIPSLMPAAELQAPYQFPASQGDASTSTIAKPGAPSRAARYDSDQGPLPSPSELLEPFSASWNSPRPAPTPPSGGTRNGSHNKSASEGAVLASQALGSQQDHSATANEKPWTFRRPGAVAPESPRASSDQQSSSASPRGSGSKSDRSLAGKMPIIQPRDESLGCLARQQRKREKGKQKAEERRSRPKEKEVKRGQGASAHVPDAFRSEATFRPTPASTLPRSLRRPMLPAAYMHQTPARMPEHVRHRSHGDGDASVRSPLTSTERTRSPPPPDARSLQLPPSPESLFSRPLLPARSSSQQSWYPDRDFQVDDGTASPASRPSQLVSEDHDGSNTAQSSEEATKQSEIDVMFAAADHCRKRQGSRIQLGDFMSPVLEQRESTDLRPSTDIATSPARKHGLSRSVDLLRNFDDSDQRVHFAASPHKFSPSSNMQRAGSNPSNHAVQNSHSASILDRKYGLSSDANADPATRAFNVGSLSSGFKRKPTWVRPTRTASMSGSTSGDNPAGQLTFGNPWILSPKQVARAEAAAAAAAAQEKTRGGSAAPLMGKDRWYHLWTATKGLANRPKIIAVQGMSRGKTVDADQSDDDDLFGSVSDYRGRRTSEQSSSAAPYDSLIVGQELSTALQRRSTEPAVRPILILPDVESGPTSPIMAPRTPPSRKAVPSPSTGTLAVPSSPLPKTLSGQNHRRYDLEPDSPVVPAMWRSDAEAFDNTPQPSPTVLTTTLFETVDETEMENQADAESGDDFEEVMSVIRDGSPTPERSVGAVQTVNVVNAKPGQVNEDHRAVSRAAAVTDLEEDQLDLHESDSVAEMNKRDESASTTDPKSHTADDATVDLASLLAAHKNKRASSATHEAPETQVKATQEIDESLVHIDDEEPSFLESFIDDGGASSDEGEGDLTATQPKQRESGDGAHSWLRPASQSSNASSNTRVLSIGSLLKLSEQETIQEEDESREVQHESPAWDGDIIFRPSPNPSSLDKSVFPNRQASSSDGHDSRVSQQSLNHPYSFGSTSSPPTETSSTDRFRFPRPPSEKPQTAARISMTRQTSDEENVNPNTNGSISNDDEKADSVDSIVSHNRRDQHTSNPSISSQSSDATNLSHFGFPSLLGSEPSRDASQRLSSSSFSPSKRTSVSTPLAVIGGTGSKRLSNSYLNGPSWASPQRAATNGSDDLRSRTVVSPVSNGTVHPAPPLGSYVRHRPTFSSDSSSSQATGRSDYSSNFLHSEIPHKPEEENAQEVVADEEKKDMDADERSMGLLGRKVGDIVA